MTKHTIMWNTQISQLHERMCPMKFKEKKMIDGFQSFSITVQTQEEANYLHALVGATDSAIDKAFNVGQGSWDLMNFLELRVDAEALPTVSVDLRD
jgi:hypothetical protein